MKNCPYCAEEILDAAIVCKHCGRDLPTAPATTSSATAVGPTQVPPKKKTSAVAWIALIIFGLVGLGMCSALLSPTPTPSSTTMEGASPAAAPQLVLLSSNGTSSSGYHHVNGQVQNVTSESLRNIEAVVSWFDDRDTFITSDSALVEFNPLLPQQTSPFRVLTRSNPEMKKFTVEFKLLGGRKLTVVEKETFEARTPFKRFARTGDTQTVAITATQLKDDSELWRIARTLQGEEAQRSAGKPFQLHVWFWIDQRYVPTEWPPTPEQLAHRKAIIDIDTNSRKETLTRSK